MKIIFEWVDNKLNAITMYRLILYYLLSLYLVAIVFSSLHILAYNPFYLIAEGAFITAVAWLTNEIFSRVFNAPTNVESVYITSLILTLILTPDSPMNSLWFYLWAPILAMSSKYILAISKKHIFNPVAIAVVITSLAIGQSADWWAGGTLPLIPFVLFGGILIVRKIRRTDLVFSFFIAFIISTVVSQIINGGNVLNTFLQIIERSPVFFFAFVMITEPLTTPPTRILRIIYGVIVGAIFIPTAHLWGIYSTPEIALVIGNLFSYIVSPKGKCLLTLIKKQKIAKDTYDFWFDTDMFMRFKAGQYMEWTLPHSRSDSRGNRRYFTIASSPTEKGIHLGLKFYPDGSTFKNTILSLNEGGILTAGSLAGDFILPKNKNKKLVFIAGGIGITPFRSMLKYLIDKNEKRDIACFYSNKTIDEVAYTDILDEAVEKLKIKMIYTLTDNIPALWRGHRGFINRKMIEQEVPDFKERYFYISGTHGMVTTFQKTLSEMGVKSSQIKTDFFPGFA